jgi:tetratricopeptide (TPR) repeat protein
MQEVVDFADVLRHFVDRSGYNMGQLSRLSDIPKRTIANWLSGQVQRPRHESDLLKLAAVLHLDEREASELLQAADHPPVPELLAISQDEATRDLLAQTVARRQEATPFQAIPDLPYFVGREKEVRALGEALLGGGQVFICSLQGMGGVGKTALAAHLAYQLRPYFRDGVLWARVDKSAPMSILSAFANAYGRDVSLYVDLESRSQVVRQILADKRALIVLDNVQRSEDVKPLLPPSLGTCAVIMTTRHQNLAVTSGIHRFTVGPFDKKREESFALFSQILGEERARRERVTLARIADLLGHLPLAVAIAASRMAYEPGWSAPEFLGNLQQEQKRLDVLTYENQSVRLSANVSYDLLQPDEQRFFAALGAFSPENLNVEAISAVTERPPDAVQTTLRKLYGLSLVHVGQGERYRLHPLLHDYARERLRLSEGCEDVLARMVHFFVGYVARHGKEYDALEREIDNIVAALEIASNEQMLSELVCIASELYFFLEMKGLYDLAAVHLERAQEAATSLGDNVGLATVLLRMAHLLRKRGEFTLARLALEEGLALARQSQDQLLISALLGDLGAVLTCLGQAAEAATYYEEGLALARELADPELISTYLLNLGLFHQENTVEAEHYYEEGLALVRQIGDTRKLVKILNNLGIIASNQGYSTKAEAYFQESLVLAQTLGYQELICIALNNLGDIARERGAYEEAEAYYQEGLRIGRQLAHKRLIRLLLEQLGELASAQKRYEAAEGFYRELLALVRDSEDKLAISHTLLKLARVPAHLA